jgi:hypothetical protein
VAKYKSDCWIETRGDVVENKVLERLFVQILSMLRSPFESKIGRHEDSVVCGCAVQKLDQVLVRVDDLRGMLGEVGFGNQLIDCQVRLRVVMVLPPPPMRPFPGLLVGRVMRMVRRMVRRRGKVVRRRGKVVRWRGKVVRRRR